MTRLLVLAAAAAIVGCTAPAPRSRADTATVEACRVRVDEVYAQQNRADLTYRDQRDTPYANSYDSGITTRGLSSRFVRDNNVANCIGGNAPGIDQGSGPTFSPAGHQ